MLFRSGFFCTTKQMGASSSSNSIKHSSAKIPPFDEKNFSLWKIKADEDMLTIVTKGPHIPMYQPLNVENVPVGNKKATPKESWTFDDKRRVGLDVKARAAISYSLPYNIFGLVQNCETAKEMMDTLTVSYEGTEETMATQINDLNLRYERFFAKKGESLINTFNRFNTLVNDLRRLDQLKHRSALVHKFLNSLGSGWEHHVDVLKNSEKITAMDLQSLYGNRRTHFSITS